MSAHEYTDLKGLVSRGTLLRCSNNQTCETPHGHQWNFQDVRSGVLLLLFNFVFLFLDLPSRNPNNPHVCQGAHVEHSQEVATKSHCAHCVTTVGGGNVNHPRSRD